MSRNTITLSNGLLMELDLYQNMEMESTADSKKMEGHDRNGTSLSTFVGT